MKKLLAVLFSVAFLLGGCTAKNVDKPLLSHADYDVLNIGNIAVGMWVTPTDAYRTDAQFKLLAESGINVVNGFGYSENTDRKVQDVLDLCGKYNLKYLYSGLAIEQNIVDYKDSGDDTLVADAMQQIEKFASHPAYAGQLFVDEPTAAYFDTLKVFIDEYKTRYPDKLAYVNMLPSYAMAGAGMGYEAYVDGWIDKLSPNIYSYDSYPLIDYDPSATGYRAEMEDYYYNLDLLRCKTLNAGIPMWAFAATLGYTHASEPNRRTPSREELRWQVFSDLVFGAKGIQYFCYFTPSQDSYGEAMVTRGGVPTERYDYVKELNAEFSKYGKILLNSDAVGIMINDYRRNGFEIYSTPLNKFGSINGAEGNRYVIGCFSDKENGSKSVLISPTTPRDDVTVTLNMAKGVKSVKAYVGGELTELKVSGGKLSVNVNHGDAVLILL